MDTNDRLIQAVQLATRKLASSGNFDLLLRDVLAICVEAVGASGGTLYLHDPATHRLRFQHVIPDDVAGKLPTEIADDFGLVGEAFKSRQVLRKHFPTREESEWNPYEKASGMPLVSTVAAPLRMEDEEPIGVVQLINKTEGDFNEKDASILDIIASVATMAFLNYRLTEESSRASTLLGMGKVSHDIGNLAAALYANLSYGELAVQSMRHHLSSLKHPDKETERFVSLLEPSLEDVKSSVERIVTYSRLISDMSAGRQLRPTMHLASMGETIYESALYLEADCQASGIALRFEIDHDAPPTMHDAQFIFRIVQNLVGNAIKAVRETIPEDAHCAPRAQDNGEVCVRYCFTGSSHLLEVHDTGPGMSEDVANRILSGRARSEWDRESGSGWGLKIVLELAATHNGVVSIVSSPGEGASFKVEFPHTPGQA